MNKKQIIKANAKQILFVCGAFFLMILIGCFSVSSVIEREVRSGVTVALNETEKTVQSYLREPIIAFNNIYLAIQGMLDKGESQTAIQEYLTHITQTMLTQKDGVQGFSGVYGFIRDQFLDGMGEEFNESFIPQQRPWYQLAIRSKQAAYTAPYVDARSGVMIISLVQELHGKDGVYHGVLSLDVDLSWMIGYAESLQFAEGGYGLIVNQYLYIIAHPDEQFKNRPLQDLGKDYATVSALLRKDHSISAKRIRDYDGTSIITFFRELYNGWYIGVVMPMRSYYSDLYRTALFLIGLGVILSIALSYLLLRLSAAKMQSDEENRSKSTFLAMMSHEVRTPLNAIIGLSDIQLRKQLPADTRADIETIHTSGTNLLGIINDILDFSKINAEGFSLVPVEYDIPSLVNDTVQLNIVRIEARPIEFHLNVSPTLPSRLFGDELRVKQVLNNLLSNACKYTRHGHITLDVDWERKQDAALLRFSIIDTGIGIKKEDLKKLFSEYSRVDLWKNRKLEGTGLGLAITKQLVESMDGDITVDSEYGKGSTFVASLLQKIVDASPIGKTLADSLKSFRFIAERDHRKRDIQRIPLPDARILVVDDVATNLAVARGLFAPYDMSVDCVSSGLEAVERMRDPSLRYDAVFMDHMMPGMDGIEAVRIIRNEIGGEYAKNIPIIALTANAVAGNEEMFLSKGFNDFVSKPVSVVKLDEVLMKWIVPSHGGAAKRETVPEVEVDDDKGAEESSVCEVLRSAGIDVDESLSRYGGELEVYKTVLRSFVKHTPDILSGLRRLDASTLSHYGVMVHGLKGSAWSIGATSVGKMAADLEAAARAGAFATVEKGNDALLTATEALLAALRSIFEDDSASVSSDKSVRDAIDRALLSTMLEACDRFDTMAMDRIVTELEKSRYSTNEMEEFISRLREQLDLLEYDALHEMLANVPEHIVG